MIITVQGARYSYGSKLLDSEKELSVYMALGSGSDGNHTGRRGVYSIASSGSQARRLVQVKRHFGDRPTELESSAFWYDRTKPR